VVLSRSVAVASRTHGSTAELPLARPLGGGKIVWSRVAAVDQGEKPVQVVTQCRGCNRLLDCRQIRDGYATAFCNLTWIRVSEDDEIRQFRGKRPDSHLLPIDQRRSAVGEAPVPEVKVAVTGDDDRLSQVWRTLVVELLQPTLCALESSISRGDPPQALPLLLDRGSFRQSGSALVVQSQQMLAFRLR